MTAPLSAARAAPGQRQDICCRRHLAVRDAMETPHGSGGSPFVSLPLFSSTGTSRFGSTPSAEIATRWRQLAVRILSSAMAWPSFEPRVRGEGVERGPIPSVSRSADTCRSGTADRRRSALVGRRAPGVRDSPRPHRCEAGSGA